MNDCIEFSVCIGKINIIPTFNGTVSAVARHNEVPEELIHAALQEMLDKGLIYQR